MGLFKLLILEKTFLTLTSHYSTTVAVCGRGLVWCGLVRPRGVVMQPIATCGVVLRETVAQGPIPNSRPMQPSVA